jgi:hypothetical protein
MAVRSVSALVLRSAAVTADPIWGLGAKYSGMFAGGTFGVGIGYQFTNDGLDNIAGSQGVDRDGLSANVALDSGFSAAINYSMIDVGVPGQRRQQRRHAHGHRHELHVRRHHPARQLRSLRLGRQRIRS